MFQSLFNIYEYIWFKMYHTDIFDFGLSPYGSVWFLKEQEPHRVFDPIIHKVITGFIFLLTTTVLWGIKNNDALSS